MNEMASDFRVSFVFTPRSWQWGWFRDEYSHTWTLEAGPVVACWTTNRACKPPASWAAVGTEDHGWRILGAVEEEG